MGVFEARPAATEVVAVNLPPGSTLRVHHPSGSRDYTHEVWEEMPDLPFIAVVPGHGQTVGWGANIERYGSLRQIRNRRLAYNRQAWDDAVKALRGGGVVYVQHEQRDRYGKPVWMAVGVRS